MARVTLTLAILVRFSYAFSISDLDKALDEVGVNNTNKQLAITLTWKTEDCDLDLYAVDPDGFEISYQQGPETGVGNKLKIMNFPTRACSNKQIPFFGHFRTNSLMACSLLQNGKSQQ